CIFFFYFFFSSRRRHTRFSRDWSSDVCSSDLSNVNFTGRKPVHTMPNYFAASDVLLISLVDVPLYEIMIPSKFQTYLTAKKPIRSEERRVGKECRYRWSSYH